MHKSKLKEQSEKLFQLHMEITGFYNELAKSHNLTLTAFKVLHIIYKKPNCTQQVITQLSFLPKQTVNAIIQTFLQQGYIELKAEIGADKRNKTIIFTEKGKQFADEIVTNLNDAEFKTLDKLGEEKINQLIEIITMYKDNLKNN